MKKIYGISLVALFAAVPLMAHATDVTPISNVQNVADIVSTSYVKGAYNDLAGYINTKADKTALESEVQTRDDADKALDSRLDVLEGGVNVENSVDYKINQAITNVNGTTDGLAERVTANENAINTINNKQIPVVVNWANGTVENVKISDLPNATTTDEPSNGQ